MVAHERERIRSASEAAMVAKGVTSSGPDRLDPGEGNGRAWEKCSRWRRREGVGAGHTAHARTIDRDSSAGHEETACLAVKERDELPQLR